MFVLAIVALLAVCAQCSLLLSFLPPVPMLDGRIVGGSPATINEAPYQVALIFGSGQACGGSIISRSVILTAAHCLSGTSASNWRIRAGSTFHNSGGQLVTVTRFLIHASYNSRLDNDVALMYMSAQLTLGSTVAIVTLPSQGQSVSDGSSAFVTGWGHLSEGGSSPTQLYKVTIPIVNQAACRNAYASFNPVTDNMICAGHLNSGGQDVCQGDSGGPLTVGSVLIGVTSWGNGCARPGNPGVWARVPNYRTWINNNM